MPRTQARRAAGGVGKGSGRSVAGFALGPAVIAARQAGLLVNGGGHAMAAGFTVAEAKLGAFRDFLAERVALAAGPGGLTPELGLDGMLALWRPAASRELTKDGHPGVAGGARAPAPPTTPSGAQLLVGVRERPEHGLQQRRLGDTALFVLPSTSPANAAVPWEERLRWFQALAELVFGRSAGG